MLTLRFSLTLFFLFGSSCISVAALNTPEVVEVLCQRMVEWYNGFVDIVPLTMTVTFPKDNDYFTGNAEMLFYNAEEGSNKSHCTLFPENDVKLLRIEVLLKLEILSNGHRMTIDPAQLTAHLRMQTSGDRLVIRPQLVDVRTPGAVLQDGKPMARTQAEEILRPLLVKVFTGLAEKYLTYNDYRASAVFIDPTLATKLFKQIFLSTWLSLTDCQLNVTARVQKSADRSTLAIRTGPVEVTTFRAAAINLMVKLPKSTASLLKTTLSNALTTIVQENMSYDAQ